MNIVKTQAAQGDVMFRRVERLPDDLRDVTPAQGKAVVAHSETGHHHVASGVSGALARRLEGQDPLVCYLQCSESILIEHLRPYDTHSALTLECGPGVVWEVRRQREWAPEGWRRVED